MDSKKSKRLILGANQSGGRLYNERLALSIVRHQDGLPKAEIAKLTGLSAQTISVIMQQLEADQLIVKGTPKRGKVGQPRVPFSLNPEGAYSIGLKIGRHRSELVLMDFVGRIVNTQSITYQYPATQELIAFVAISTPLLIHSLDEHLQSRITGIGIATPFELWNWGKEIAAPKDVMAAWKDFDIQKEISEAAKLPAFLLNDATAACAAELTFGNSQQYDNFLYIHIGYFVGGGVVLNGSVFPGPTGNAGALAALPVRTKTGKNKGSYQLVRDASKLSLQRLAEADGKETSLIWEADEDWSALGATLDTWLKQLSDDLAYAITAATAVIDFPAVVIDGDIPVEIREHIVKQVSSQLADTDRQGLSPVTVLQGSLGRNARLVGGASLPLIANFSRDRDIAFGGL
ncbi:ROK family transcriptional regulator [Leucothrix sargassi]|nr:ROK family transcriptional regulator [Leucothrix sargassi]